MAHRRQQNSAAGEQLSIFWPKINLARPALAEKLRTTTTTARARHSAFVVVEWCALSPETSQQFIAGHLAMNC